MYSLRFPHHHHSAMNFALPSPLSLSMDTRSGFCPETNTFHSLRPPIPLPLETLPLSVAAYAFSLLPTTHLRETVPALIDSSTGDSLSYPDFLAQVRNLASSLRSHIGLHKGNVAFVLSPTRIHIPVLYFALLSIGVVVSPSNPVSTPDEVARQFHLAKPTVAFATSSTAHKLPRDVTTILLDSPLFHSLLQSLPSDGSPNHDEVNVVVHQRDVAAIQFSSGTTGRAKAAALTHRNFIAMVAGFHALRNERSLPAVTVLAAPMFHSLGFFFVLRGIGLGETTVLLDRIGVPDMLRTAEKYRATQMTASPPLVLAISRCEEASRMDLRSLERVFCGGAPLPEEVSENFVSRFPWVEIEQGLGSTEGGGIARMIGHEECQRYRSVGRLNENIQAKIVHPVSREALSVGLQGELCLRGPTIMKGYVGDDEATASTFESDGWLKTGDLCYFDNDGFLYVVDRLKELIKYKAYQVPPAELEQLLQSLPEIIDAAVIPYPHKEAGQIPMAFVVRQRGSTLSESQVMDFVAKHVAPYKKIRKVAFINSIPKSASGKILRRELANHVLSSFASRL